MEKFFTTQFGSIYHSDSFRFTVKQTDKKVPTYNLSHPAALWDGVDNETPLPADGGRQRPGKTMEQTNAGSF